MKGIPKKGYRTKTPKFIEHLKRLHTGGHNKGKRWKIKNLESKCLTNGFKKGVTVFSGNTHPNWKGGISKDSHSPSEPKYKKWRSSVFERDNWTCQTCGIRGTYLEAHHIKSWAQYPELRDDLENGVCLCKECHKLTNNYKGRNNQKKHA